MSAAAISIKRLWAQPDALGIEWSDGSQSEFASLWLRDNEEHNRDPHSGQRLIDVADLPEAPQIRAATLDERRVKIEWQFENRSVCFDTLWLHQHRPGQARRGALSPKHWLEGARLDAAQDFAWIGYAAARSERALRAHWMTRLLEDGIAFMSDVPATAEGIVQASALIGRVCPTNYGLVYDVRSVAQPQNLAYSDLGLGLHTDNPYREPVPGFQVLHALICSPDGGESLFGDGFALAEHLRQSEPQAFARLASTAVPFHYRSADAELYAERPLLQLNCAGEVRAVHYNNRSIAPLPLPAAEAREFYAAYRRFAALLRDPRFHLKLRLGEGDLAVFDNQRILHGRTAFSSSRHPRHLRGCYLTRDSVHCEAALLRRAPDQAGSS